VNLVELCAGTASLSLAWLSPQGVCPLTLIGSKRSYRNELLDLFGLKPGGGATEQVVLVEPGPFGDFWLAMKDPVVRGNVVSILRFVLATWPDPRTLWDEMRIPYKGEDFASRVAHWAVLQFWSYFAKPVIPQPAGCAANILWKTHGFDKNSAYRSDTPQAARENITKNKRLPQLIEGIQALPRMSNVQVYRQRAQDFDPATFIGETLVYIDPHYAGTTNSYGHEFPREDVLRIAHLYDALGCRVAVSEAAPLPLRGPQWRAVRIGGPRARGRTTSRQQAEYVTLNF
jgi:hypothetical protein